ncbi:hypothetical protein [Xylanibacter rodentium]|uniref:hypothetical protein n=1 Tax=Xylanibacter rodentium TaxID=2736289 RepID=UPI00259CAB0C|nr:hypothetical protein [Xylanibacter rodentium]
MNVLDFNDLVDKEDRKNVQKWYKSLCQRFVKEYGFVLHKPNFLVRVNQDIPLAYSICFDYTASQLIVHTAMQPLYSKSDVVHFTCGARIDEYLPSVGHSLCGYKSELEPDKHLVEERLVHDVLPLFDSIQSTNDFINFLENMSKTPFRCRDIFHYEYIAYGYLQMENYTIAERKLEFLLTYSADRGYSYDMSEASKLLRCIQRKDYDVIKEILAGNIEFTRAHCGLY